MREEALDIFEPGAHISGQQLDSVQSDADLREACSDLMAMQGMLADSHFDTEAALRRFHESHATTPPLHHHIAPLPHRRYPILRLLAAAAVFVGAIFLLRTALDMGRSTTEQTTAFFLADATSPNITVKIGTQPTVPLSAIRCEKDADQLVTPDDLRPFAEKAGDTDKQLIAIPYGESLKLYLSDGTCVYMHPSSQLTYPNKFVGDKREVHLVGEAYFCVSHDEEQPFIVHTRQGDIRDYGTEFNIHADYNQTDVVLIEGSASVTPQGGEEVMMKPGQMATLHSQQPALNIQTVDTDPYAAWRDGFFYFDQTTLRDILMQLGRSYNLNVEVRQRALLDLHLRFMIPRNSTPYYAVRKLNELIKEPVELNGNTIVVG